MSRSTRSQINLISNASEKHVLHAGAVQKTVRESQVNLTGCIQLLKMCWLEGPFAGGEVFEDLRFTSRANDWDDGTGLLPQPVQGDLRGGPAEFMCDFVYGSSDLKVAFGQPVLSRLQPLRLFAGCNVDVRFG